jgi:hypothetical protein
MAIMAISPSPSWRQRVAARGDVAIVAVTDTAELRINLDTATQQLSSNHAIRREHGARAIVSAPSGLWPLGV